MALQEPTGNPETRGLMELWENKEARDLLVLLELKVWKARKVTRAPLVSQALRVSQELWDRKEKAGRLVWSDIRATKATAVIQDLWG